MKTRSARNLRTMPAKRKSAVPAKQVPVRGELIRAHDATFLGANGPHWTIRVQPGETFYIADNIGLFVVIKNHGPGMIGIPGRNDATEKILAGGLWLMYVVGELTIDGMDDKPALVEMDFLARLS